MTITEFLLTRIAEDEAAVPYRPAPTVGDDVLAQLDEAQRGYRPLKPGVMTVTTARVQAECQAKRLIVEVAATWIAQAEQHATGRDVVSVSMKSQAISGESVLRNLASVYADHPDYREEWRAA